MKYIKIVTSLVLLCCVLLLSCIITHAETEAVNDLIPSTETAYINNKSTGKYLMGNSNTLTSASGLIANMGSLIKWKITPLGSNIYTIQSESNNTLFLAASTNANTSTLYLTTLDDASIPNRYRWKITAAIGGGCLIKNVFTSKYMYASGSTISSSSTVGTSGTEQYMQRVWRIAESTSYYGNDSSYTKIELPANYKFKTLYMFTGQTKEPDLLDIYDNVLFRNAYDFTYSGYDTSCVSFDPVTGKFTASSSLTTMYNDVISVTHKVTGRTANLNLVVNPKCASVSITATGHDHSTCLTNITPYIVGCGYSGNTTFFGTYSVNTIKNTMSLKANNVFVTRSHGSYFPLIGAQTGTGIFINTDSSGNAVYFRSDTSMSNLELSNMKLMVFVACHTGEGGVNAPNLPNVAVQLGATTAIGFNGGIICAEANTWTTMLFYSMYNNNYTISQATAYAAAYVTDPVLQNPVICGNANVKINN